MMRAYYCEESKDWDEGAHMLLFAVRESMHESLGFTQFVLMFGHVPQGPLKLLKEAWFAVDSSKDIIARVINVHHGLRKATDFARRNLQQAHGNMKTWYDKRA